MGDPACGRRFSLKVYGVRSSDHGRKKNCREEYERAYKERRFIVGAAGKPDRMAGELASGKTKKK